MQTSTSIPSFTSVISNGGPQKGQITLSLLQYSFKGIDLTVLKFRLHIAERKSLFIFQHFMEAVYMVLIAVIILEL